MRRCSTKTNIISAVADTQAAEINNAEVSFAETAQPIKLISVTSRTPARGLLLRRVSP